MKKTYKIDVDCANCANKMESAAQNTAGVKSAVVNFMALKMVVELSLIHISSREMRSAGPKKGCAAHFQRCSNEFPARQQSGTWRSGAFRPLRAKGLRHRKMPPHLRACPAQATTCRCHPPACPAQTATCRRR